MPEFSKPATTPLQQLNKLKSRGLNIPDEVKALSYLQHVGGFRLKGYYYYVLDQDKRFPPGYDFDQIAQAYEFDRQLRIITFSTITRLEISIRSAIANYLSLSHGY